MGLRAATLDPHTAVAITYSIEFNDGIRPVLFLYDDTGNYIRLETNYGKVVTGFELPTAWEPSRT